MGCFCSGMENIILIDNKDRLFAYKHSQVPDQQGVLINRGFEKILKIDKWVIQSKLGGG